MITETERLDAHHNGSTGDLENVETKKRQERRLRLMQLAGHLGNDHSGASYQRATSVQDLEDAYRLVHDVYVTMGYITKQRNGLRMRPFEFCPDTATFIAKSPLGAVIGSISVIEDSVDLGLPSDCVFKQEIDQIRGPGKKVCEMSNQAVLKEFRRLGPAGELMRCAGAYAIASQNTDIVCAVSPQLVALYETIFFKQVGPMKRYSDAVEDNVVLMRMPNLQTQKEDPRYHTDEVFKKFIDYYYTDNPHFTGMKGWEVENAKLFNEAFDIAGLFGKCPEIVLNHAVSEALHKRLGNIFVLSQLMAETTRLPRSPYRTVRHDANNAERMKKSAEAYFGNTGNILRRSQAPAASSPKVN